MATIKTPGSTIDAKTQGGSHHVLSCSAVTGFRVRDSQGDDLGTIKEIMIDMEQGRVAYAVLSFGAMLGVTDKLFAVPWSALKMNQSTHEFMLHADRRRLESAPSFDKNHWPDMLDNAWCQQVYSYYGATPYWQAGAEKIQRSGGHN